MGSEHYCLRWNNHQSNLLGVFSQLLQDESLVDVTLACSEGAPIRAHKVVLSACSSYFQSLFLDHPERHPIVILKDVRFAELQTLVEFMYKGEVNVQYCQLQALLKTAESLKVKGLAEMTNQNSSLREPEREPDRLRPHSQPNKSISCDSPVDAALTAGTGPSTSTAIIATPPPPLSTPLTTTSGATSSTPTGNTRSATPQAAVPVSNAASAAHKRDTSERGSPLPTKRLQTAPEQDTPLALDLFQRRAVTATESEECSNRSETNAHNSSNSSSSNQNQHLQNRSNTPGGASGTSSNLHNNSDDHELLHSPNERPASCIAGIPKIEDVDDYDEAMDLDEDDDNSSNEVGLNMKIGTGGCVSGRASTTVVIPSPLGGGAAGGDPESARSTPAATLASERSAMPSDLTQRPASRSSRDGGASGSGVHRRASTERERPSSIGVCGLPTTSGSGGGVGAAGSLGCSSMSPTSSTAAMGVGNESLASGGGLGPVQSVPLSLKKEIDCSEDDNSSSRHMQPRSASASGVLGGELDYRTAHESETSESPHGGSGGGGGGGGGGSGGNATSATHDQPHTPPPIFPCLYCGLQFSQQKKLTRHILSHSLKTLEYRETATHPLIHSHLLPPELNMALPQQFPYQMNPLDPQDVMAAAAAMEMDLAAAVAAAGGCSLAGLPGCGVARGMDLDGTGVDGGGGGGGGSSGRSGSGGGSASGNGGGLMLSGAGSSTSTSAAAAAAAAAASGAPSTSSALLGASSDPNSVVLCKFCGKSFPEVASLITHLTVHTGDRPFKCEFCGKAFKLRHHMKDHCRVHTGERPFRCHMCGKTFSRSTILKAHEKTHFPKYVRKFLSPSPVDTKDELPQ